MQANEHTVRLVLLIELRLPAEMPEQTDMNGTEGLARAKAFVATSPTTRCKQLLLSQDMHVHSLANQPSLYVVQMADEQRVSWLEEQLSSLSLDDAPVPPRSGPPPDPSALPVI